MANPSDAVTMFTLYYFDGSPPAGDHYAQQSCTFFIMSDIVEELHKMDRKHLVETWCVAFYISQRVMGNSAYGKIGSVDLNVMEHYINRGRTSHALTRHLDLRSIDDRPSGVSPSRRLDPTKVRVFLPAGSGYAASGTHDLWEYWLRGVRIKFDRLIGHSGGHYQSHRSSPLTLMRRIVQLGLYTP